MIFIIFLHYLHNLSTKYTYRNKTKATSTKLYYDNNTQQSHETANKKSLSPSFFDRILLIESKKCQSSGYFPCGMEIGRFVFQ